MLCFRSSTGWLEDLTGNWNASFYMTGCLFLLAALVVTLESFVGRHCGKPDQHNCNLEYNDVPLNTFEDGEIVVNVESTDLAENDSMLYADRIKPD